MADPLVTRPSRLRSLTTNAPTAEEMAAEDALQTSLMSPVSRGFAAGGYGMTAGSFADEALDAQLAGQDPAALEEQALFNAQRAAQVAPRVRSLRDVNNLNDFGTLVGADLGQAGATMAPVLGAALLTRGRALPGVTSFAGAAVPAYQLERGEAVLNQLTDPELAAKDAQARSDMARNKALANAALESLVPATLSRGLFMRGASPLRTLGTAALEEGATEGLQEATGILANETLRRDGDVAGALPELATADNLQQIADAGFAGAVGGGGMSLPTAGTQVVANALERSAKAAKAGGEKALEKVADKSDGLVDWARETLTDEDAAAELNRQHARPSVVPNDDSEQAVIDAVNSGDPALVQQAMDAHEQAQPGLRARAAQNLIEDKNAPPELHALASKVLAGTASDEEQAQLLGHAAGYQAGRVAKHVAARGIVALDDAVKFGKEQFAALKDKAGKQNAMDPSEEPALVEALFERVKPEFRDNPKVRSKLAPMIKLFRRLDESEPTRETYEVMQRLAPALELFDDPSKVVPKSLRQAYEGATRAQTEARDENSWLSQNLTPAFKQTAPEARAELGRLIDRAALGEELGGNEMALLRRAFGGKGAANTMLRHYKLQVPLLKRTRQETEDAPEQVVEVDEDKGFTERDAEHTYHYAGSNKQAFLNMRKEGERAPAHALAREKREGGERAEVVNLLQLAREQGTDPAAEAARLRADFAERNERGRASLEEQVLHEATADDDAALLRAHQVVRTSKRDNAEDKLLQAHKLKAQPLVRQANNPRATPEHRAAAKSTLFTVRRSDGEDMTLSAESLWKHFNERQRSEKTDRGIRENQPAPDAARVQELFTQAVAELALDPEVHGLDMPEGLVLDRQSGVTLAKDERLETEKFRQKFKRGKHDAAALQALTDKEFSKRAKELASNVDRPVSARLDELSAVANPDLEGIKGPRRAYLRRRAEMARDAMVDLVNKLVPPPSETEPEAFGEGETEAFGEAAQRAYRAQNEYVSDLADVIGDRDDLQWMLDKAQARLDELEEKANPVRGYDETTGEATIPSRKEAAYNASGVKEMARQAQKDLDEGAPNGIAIPTPTKIDGKEDAALTVRNDQRPSTPVFNKLPAHDPARKTMTYAGVGSRQTPPDIMAKFRAVAKRLEQLGYTLNTGDAAGADQAFRSSVENKNVFTTKDATDTTRAIAKEIHPNPAAISRSPYVLDLQARNTNQVFGKDLDTPVDFVLVWTKDGSETQRGQGGTGQAMDMALRKGIPVINAATSGWEQRLKAIIEAKPGQRNVSDLQTRPKPDRAIQAKPVTPAEAAARRARDEAQRAENQAAARQRAAERRAAHNKTPAQAYKDRVKNNAQAVEIHRELGRSGFAATHDSPHKFDGQFNWRQHAFKGEGAMAFGAGTYLSTSDGVHKSYKEKFTAQVNGGIDPQEDLAFLESALKSHKKELEALKKQLADLGGDMDGKYVASLFTLSTTYGFRWDVVRRVFASKAEANAAVDASIEKLKEQVPQAESRKQHVRLLSDVMYQIEDEIAILQEQIDDYKEFQPSPTYQVSVEADEGEILDWDAPLDEQHPEVQEKLNEVAGVTKVTGPDIDMDGDYFTVGSQRIAVMIQQEGIWYLRTHAPLGKVLSKAETSDEHDARGQFWGEFQEGKHDAYLQEAATPTGESIYRALQDKLGSQEKASDFLQAAGIVGHKYAANAGRQDKFPNYVIYDDSKITTNAVSFNKQNRKASGIGISRALKNEIAAEIKRITGLRNTSKATHLFFVRAKDIGGASGQYSPAQRAIKIAISSVDPLGVAYHEALHDFIDGLQASPEGRELRKSLFRAAELPHIRAQLKELLKGHPDALRAIESDAEERVAYLFQFHAVGKHLGQDIIKVNDVQSRNALARLAQWIRELLGVVSQSGKAEAILDALYDGRFADRNVVGHVIHDMQLDTIADKARRLAGPLAEVHDKLMLVSTDRLRSYGVEALDQLADMMHTEPGREQGKLRFLQRREQQAAKFDNRKAALFKHSTAEERAVAVRNLQAMKPPSTPLEREVRKLLDDLYDYMDKAGVKQFDAKSKTWKDLPRVKNYFPRRWDASKILANEAEFKALLATHGGVSADQQAAIVQAVTRGDGIIDLADNQYHVGYTPAAVHVQNRQLTFIDETNAEAFAKFQSQDLADTLTGYIYQAVHRAEFARDFGNAGELIDEHMQEAAKHLDGKQLAEAQNTIKGLVGTLGADINPRLKSIMSAAITAENLILLPLTMFSQFIDALGVGLRAQAPEEAWHTFKRAMGDFVSAVRKKGPDYDTEMATTLGLISEQNMLEAMGQAQAGAFMSKFARDTNKRFFRWNGMELWNRSMRVSAMVAAERFIQRNLTDARFMHELGLETEDDAVMVMPDGRLALTAEQMVGLGATKAQAAKREEKIQAAVFRFVDGAVLRPNSAQRPVWGSDPHWMLMFHLKQFAFSFQKTILARVNNEYEHGQMMPSAILAAYVPVTIASGLVKSMLTGQPIGDGSLMATLNYGIMRSGVLGAQSFGADAFGDLERGQLPGASLLGPAVEHAWMASRFVVGDPEIDAGRIFDRSVPLAKYM